MNSNASSGFFHGLPGYAIVMLILGIALFVILAVAFIILLVQKRKFTMLLPFFILPIVMIGFPSIKSFKGAGFEFDAQSLQANIAAVEDNPKNETATADLQAALQAGEKLVTTNNASAEVAEAFARGQAALGHHDRAVEWASVAVQKDPGSESARTLLARTRLARLLPDEAGRPLTPQARSDLVVATRELNESPKLTPQAYYTLSKAQFALANTNAAATNLMKAMKANTNLMIDPKLKVLLKAPFRLPP